MCVLLIHFIRAQNKDPKALDEWEESGQAKVVLKAQSEEELYVLVGWLQWYYEQINKREANQPPTKPTANQLPTHAHTHNPTNHNSQNFIWAF